MSAFNVDDYFEKIWLKHLDAVAAGKHDEQCEYTRRQMMCHCKKRRREARGLVKPPTEDLDFPPPGCPVCYDDLDHDGDGWYCEDCSLSWDGNGFGSSATFTDDYGDLIQREPTP